MVPIPVAVAYRTTISGRVAKNVRCEKCSYEYCYVLQSTAAGMGISPLLLDNEGAQSRAAENAAVALHQNLSEGCEVVPCPTCGTVQQHMFTRARQRHLRWMWKTGLIALAVAGILTVPAVIYTLLDLEGPGITALTVIALCVVTLAWSAGVALLVLRVRLCNRYDPNSTPVEDRKRQGQQSAFSKEEILKAFDQV